MKDIIDLIEQGAIRRYFRSRNKLYFEGAISHITQHAVGKDPLFLEESDYLYMLHLIKKICNFFKIKLSSFALMLNHIHLLIKLMDSNLPIAMKELFQAYAEYFNKKYERKGHVFNSSYRSAVCLEEGYLIAVSLYIHLNPVRAGLVTNPGDYRWSSCSLFLNGIEKDTFVDYKFILNLLDEDLLKARLKYKNLMTDYLCREKKIREEKNRLRLIDNKRGNARDRADRKVLIEKLKSKGLNISEISKELGLSRQSVHKYLIS